MRKAQKHTVVHSALASDCASTHRFRKLVFICARILCCNSFLVTEYTVLHLYCSIENALMTEKARLLSTGFTFAAIRYLMLLAFQGPLDPMEHLLGGQVATFSTLKGTITYHAILNDTVCVVLPCLRWLYNCQNRFGL